MNPETLQKWFRPVEVNSHQADGTASPRPCAGSTIRNGSTPLA
jgi:hypothetical protein